MRSERQVEASTAARRAAIYKKIAAVIESMPDRFRALDLYKAAGITRHNHPGQRMMIASVLRHDFGCEQVGDIGRQHWRKGGAEPL